MFKRIYRFFQRRAKVNLREFARNNFWLTGGRLLAIVTGIGITVAFANLLSPESFGTYKYVLAAAGIISAFGLNGLSTAIARAAATQKLSAVPGAIRTGLLWNIPASIAALGISIYYFAHGANILGTGFLFIAISNTVTNSFGYAKSLLSSSGDFRRATLINIPRSLIPIFIMIGTILLTDNVIYILAVYFATNAIATWSLYAVQARILRIKGSTEHVGETIRYAKHMSVIGVFLLIGSQIDQLLIWHSVGAAGLAMYAIARSPVTELTNLLGNITTIAFPRFAQKSVSEVGESLSLRMLQMFFIACVVCGLYVLCAPYLFALLFPKYVASVAYTQVLAVVILLQPKGLIETALVAHGKIRSRYLVTGFNQAVLFAACLTLIPLYGIWGAVWSSIAAEVASGLALLFVYRKLYASLPAK